MWWSSITLFSKPTIFISFKSTIVCGISNQDRKQIQEYTINVAITQTVPTNMKNLLGKIHRYSCSKYLQKNWSRIKCLPIKNISCRSFNRCCNRWRPWRKLDIIKPFRTFYISNSHFYFLTYFPRVFPLWNIP